MAFCIVNTNIANFYAKMIRSIFFLRNITTFFSFYSVRLSLFCNTNVWYVALYIVLSCALDLDSRDAANLIISGEPRECVQLSRFRVPLPPSARITRIMGDGRMGGGGWVDHCGLSL